MPKKTKEKATEVIDGIVNQESRRIVFEATVSVDGVSRTGSFTAKFMGVFDRIRMGNIMSGLLNGKGLNDVDPHTSDLVYMVAFLDVTLIETPKWWNLEKVDYEDELAHIFNVVDKFQQSFRGADGATSDAGSSENAASETPVESLQGV